MKFGFSPNRTIAKGVPVNKNPDLTYLTPTFQRRDFVKIIGLGTAGITTLDMAQTTVAREAGGKQGLRENEIRGLQDPSWPVLRYYDQEHLARIALPLGGIGTGTVSLSGRGALRDWEIMNRPAKGFVPAVGEIAPFFALYLRAEEKPAVCRVLEGPVEFFEYEGSHGSTAQNENYPRFRNCSFAAAYPLGRVMLSDPDLPVDVDLKAFNPLIPCDPEGSGIPIAVLRYEVHNRTPRHLKAAICGSLPNYIGMDGWETARDWKGDRIFVGAKGNRNEFRRGSEARGIFMLSSGVDRRAAGWGTIALATNETDGVSHRTSWTRDRWGTAMLDFWDDFSVDGALEERDGGNTDMPISSLAVAFELPPNGDRTISYVLAWHFPNRYSWTPRNDPPAEEDLVGNYYTTQYRDAWAVVEKTAPRLRALEEETVRFVQAFCSSSLPPEIKEAALFNVSTLRTQTCFRTPDGRFFGWEGTGNAKGCCHGSCTHVWNYEQATPLLFGSLAMSMREVEFGHATADSGLMSFRVNLPLGRSQEFGKGAADGQMGCIMKMYRDWQLSGNDATLRKLWPKVRKALEFCWIQGGWDNDRDGVMEGCQHNTMDVEYYGPNPQMEGWYLGALRAAEEMARHTGDADFADQCRALFDKGSRWTDTNLFNGEFYEHQVRPIEDKSAIAPSLLVGMGASDPAHPDYQLGAGCLVDQLVGQYMAHVCGLGYLLEPRHVRKTLESVLKYNLRESLGEHFNCMRTFALGDESALLMASYPRSRPQNPFPYFTEVMTGFEYTAAVGMLYEGMLEEGLRCIRDIRERYDGRKRNPFDEAECGHHYARAMASWAAVLALSGFKYSAVTKTMTFAATPGIYFWSNGYSWGSCRLEAQSNEMIVRLQVHAGEVHLARFVLRNLGESRLEPEKLIRAGEEMRLRIG